MAVTLYDLEVTILDSTRIEGASTEEKAKLFRKSEVTDKKPKSAGSVSAERVDTEAIEGNLSFEDIVEAYDELKVRAEDILRDLSRRAEGLDYIFDPNKEVPLGEAVSSIFGVNSKITYKMYIAALKLDKDIAVALGEENSVNIG